MAMTVRGEADGREGGVLVLVLVVVLVVACLVLWGRTKKAEGDGDSSESAMETEATGGAFAEVDAVLSDTGPTKAADGRGEAVKRSLAEMKSERAKVEAAQREALASKKSREADVSRLRSDIQSAKSRIARLKEEWEEDPADEEAKQRLYDALVKLRGGEGVEGLETRLERAKAALEASRGRADALSRRLAALDSAVATAESQGKDVVDWVRFEEAEEAVGAARGHGTTVAGLAESTEGRALEMAAEDEAAKARRDSSLEALLEGL